MGIKTVKYRANSIIYFDGDLSDRVYILKKGSIVATSRDLKNNKDQLTIIKVGEFIGVKSVISNQPYSETVSTLTDCELVVFNRDDFKKFIMGNNRIMMQTMGVFSNQLRKMHNDIKELTDAEELMVTAPDPEKDMFELGVYFMKQGKKNSTIHCFTKYLEIYSKGRFANKVRNYLESGDDSDLAESGEIDEGLSIAFQEGHNYFDEKNYEKASECFTRIISARESQYLPDAKHLNGVCLFQLKEYKKCIQNYGDFIAKYKTHENILDVLYYVGCSYKRIGDLDQSIIFLNQVIKKGQKTPLAIAAAKELKE